jgi:hypothetical protein
MPTRIWFGLTEILITVVLVAILLAAWRADRRDAAKLTADLAAAKQSLTEATTRQHERDTQLLQTLATLAADKRTATTPTQILRDLPKQIPLPVPLRLQDPNPAKVQSNATCSSGLPWSWKGSVCEPEGLESTKTRTNVTSNVAATQALIPAADLKPLYDFAIDCNSCQAKLTAAQADLADERAKSAILTRERDEAIRVAKGGSLLRRIARNAKWLAIGVLAGAVAATARR